MTTHLQAESYKELRARHSKEYNEFVTYNMFYAFSDEQFKNGMTKLGLKETDTNKILRTSMGGFLLKVSANEYEELLRRHRDEHRQAIASDKTGMGYIKQMFMYEMQNQEYAYTMDVSDTLRACGLSIDEVNNSKPLTRGLHAAHNYCMKNSY